MRVLFVENAIGFGGSITGLVDLIKHLPAEVEPHLISNYDVRPFVELPPGLDYRCAGIPNPPPHPGGAIRGIWRLFRHEYLPWRRALAPVLRDLKPDLIHTNNASLINAPVGLIGRRFGIPVISHQKGWEHGGRLARLVLSKKLYARHLATSPSMGRRLQELGLSPDRWEAIYEPVEPPAAVGDSFSRSPGDPVNLVMCSMLTPWKGQDVLLRALGRLRESHASRFRLTLAGSAPAGDETFPDQLRTMVGELGLGATVHFAGRVRDIFGLLSRSDVAIHASVMPEPFGRVVAEAMIAGLPVIASRAGGPADYIVDGATGLLFESSNDEDLARQLARLIDDPALRTSLGGAARTYALEAFDPVRLGRELVEIYRRVLAGAR
jgi:glycosyltransferase involved in cell wall biosynthesis